MNEIIFEPVAARFRLHRRRRVEFGLLYITRLMYSIDAEGKAWQVNLFCCFVGVLTLFTVLLDCSIITLYLIAKLAFIIAIESVKMLFYLCRVAIDKGLGTALKWLIPAIIIILIYLKWHEITAILGRLTF